MKHKVIALLGAILCVLGFVSAVTCFFMGGLYFETSSPNPEGMEKIGVFISDILPSLSLAGFILSILLFGLGLLMGVSSIILKKNANGKRHLNPPPQV